MSQLSFQVRFSPVAEREPIKYAITSVSKRQPQIDSCTVQRERATQYDPQERVGIPNTDQTN